MPRGGYRRPENPAAVSGPGAHSKRTDGKQPVVVAPGGDYGEAKALAEMQSASPLPQVSGAAPAQAGPVFDTSGVVPLSAPTQWPDTPVTDGAALGAGAGPEALGVMSPFKQDAQEMAKYLPTLLALASNQAMPPGFHSIIRRIVANS